MRTFNEFELEIVVAASIGPQNPHLHIIISKIYYIGLPIIGDPIQSILVSRKIIYY